MRNIKILILLYSAILCSQQIFPFDCLQFDEIENYILWEEQNVTEPIFESDKNVGNSWQLVEVVNPTIELIYQIARKMHPTDLATSDERYAKNLDICAISGISSITTAYINLVQPENLCEGNAFAIRWQSSSVFQVNILFSTDNGQVWDTIYNNVDAEFGIKNWPLPEAAENCLLKLVDATDPDIFAVSQPFVIMSAKEINLAKYHGGNFDGYAKCDNHNPELEITHPVAGEIWNGLSNKQVTWSAENTYRIMILISFDDGNSWLDTLEPIYPGDALRYSLIVPNIPTEVARIKLVSLDVIGMEVVSEAFTIPEPYIEITNDFEGLLAGTPHPIYWESSGISHLNFYYSPDQGSSWDTIALGVNSTNAMQYWKVPDAGSQGIIRLTDTLQNISDQVQGIVIADLPQHSPVKYQGGSYDGYSMSLFQIAEFGCPPDTAVCEGAPAFEVTGASPPGGAFSGIGMVVNAFDPTTAGLGIHEITYTFTYFNGSSTSCIFSITVNPLPEMTCPADMEFCISDAPYTLSGATPQGGVYTGNGIEAGVFDPAQAGSGTHEIVYQYTNENSCSNQCSFYITVHELPQMSCPEGFAVCIDEPAIALNTAQPEGGTYQGTGVSNGFFYPETVGAGSHEITYTFTDENTCTNTCSFSITVNPLPVMVCPADFDVCIDAGIMELPQALPDGGTYSGNGVSGTQFNPATAGTGTHTISYDFTDANGCYNTCDFTILVNELPEMSCQENMEVCIDHDLITLSGGSPTGGVYIGAGVEDGIFDPSLAGAGLHEIQYVFTDLNSCSNGCTFNILVNPLPVMSCPDNIIVCIDGEPFTLENAQPEGGEYSGPGVTNGNFDPQLAGIGNHEISYTYTDENMCTASCNFVISVKPLPVVTCPGNYAVCRNDEPFALTGASPNGGVYSGTGVVNGIFDPARAGTGIKNISYFYEDAFGCANQCTFKVTVLPVPVVACPANIEVCVDETPFEIVGLSPEGGELSGNGINGTVFDPALAGAGTHSITYSYTSPINFCTNSCEFQITVQALPEITCGAQIEVCLDEGAFNLENATPAGGIYSGTGVEDGIFNPGLAGIGTHSINYFLTDENGCSSACDFSIIVHPVPEMSYPEGFGLCIYEAPLLLDMATPQGGTYFGTGIEDGVFDPELAGAGTHVIAYEYANEFGCSNSCSFEITVYPIPELSCNPPESVCKYNGPVSLAVCSPSGGTYTGFGVAGNTFFPEIAGEGAHVISYHYTDAATSCENEVTFTMNVLPSQLVDLPMGWSGVSSFLIPVDPDISGIFTDAGNKLEILYNFDGTVYYPDGNLIPENPWDMYSGYCLKMNQPVEMDFCGDYLQELTVQLHQGWNLIPMLSKNPVSSDFVFGFNDDIQIVKQVAGWKVFWKEMGINTLGYVNPGKAYYVYCTAETSISYPYYDGEVLPEQKPDEEFTSPFNPVAPTPSSHIMAFSPNATAQFKVGDIIAAFTQTGICAGHVQVTDDRPSLVVFGDDPYSEIQHGLFTAESITYRLYRPETANYFDLELSWDYAWQSGATFQPEGISVVTGVKLSAVGISSLPQSSISIYPNPTTGLLHIAGIDGDYKVEVFNAVQEKILASQLNGKDQLDLSAFPKGMYLIKITTGDYSVTKKVVVN